MQECFILGSGRSLLNLTKEEVAHVNNNDFVLAFNKYLIFYKKVGIVPTHYMMLDAHPPAHRVLYEALHTCYEDRLDNISFILHESWRQTIARCNPVSGFLDALLYSPHLNRLPLYRLTHWIQPPLNSQARIAISFKAALFLWRQRQDLLRRTTFVTHTHPRKGGEWATAMGQTLFHFRGTLTTAINVAHIMHPSRKIKLLGVDLNNNTYFFDEEIAHQTAKWQDWTANIPDRERHTSVLSLFGCGGMHESFPLIRRNIERSNGALVCCNPSSYLVECGTLDYEPVVTDPQAEPTWRIHKPAPTPDTNLSK